MNIMYIYIYRYFNIYIYILKKKRDPIQFLNNNLCKN